MSGATGDFAAGAAVTPPPRGRTSGSTDAQSAAPNQGLRAYYNRVSPNSYMSTAWSSPGARAVEPSPEQHASRRQPIDMSSIPRMLLSCTSAQLPYRIKALHPGNAPEVQRYRRDMEDAVILLRRNAADRKKARPGLKRLQQFHGNGPKRQKHAAPKDPAKDPAGRSAVQL